MTHDDVSRSSVLPPDETYLEFDLSPRWAKKELASAQSEEEDVSYCSSVLSLDEERSDDETTVVTTENEAERTPVSSDATTPTSKEGHNAVGAGDLRKKGESVSQAKKRIIKELTYQLSETQRELNDASAVFRLSREQNIHLSHKCATLEAELALVRTERVARKWQNGAKNSSKVRELQTENATLEGKCKSLQSMIAMNEKAAEDLTHQLKALKKEKAKQEDSFIQKLSVLTESQDDYEQKLEAKNVSIAHLQQQVGSQEQLIKRLDGEIRNLKEDLKEEEERKHAPASNDNAGEGGPPVVASSSTNHHQLSCQISTLEEDKELLQEQVKTLTLVNKSMHKEVVDLREQVDDLSNVKDDVVPDLECKLEAATQTIQALERNLHERTHEQSEREEFLKEALEEATSAKTETEEKFMGLLLDVEEKKKSIVDRLEKEMTEKDEALDFLEQKTASLHEKLVQLQSRAELESISGREQMDKLLQINLASETKLAEKDEIIGNLGRIVKEYEGMMKAANLEGRDLKKKAPCDAEGLNKSLGK